MRKGFTLIEMSIALAIAAVLFSAVVMGVGSLTGAKAKEAATDLVGVMRSLYDTAALKGKTCRLVFELPDSKSEDTGQVKYRAECAANGLAVNKDRELDLKEIERLNKQQEEAQKRDQGHVRESFKTASSANTPSVQELMAREKDRVEAQAKFSDYTDSEITERILPSNVRVHVWTKQQRHYIEKGPAFVYFFPQGFTERTQIVVKQGDNAWTLSMSPLTGKIAVVSESLEVPSS